MVWQTANIQNLNHVAALVMYHVVFSIPKTKAKGLTTAITWYCRSFNFFSQYRFLGLLFWFWVLSQSHCIIQELLHYCNLQLHYFFMMEIWPWTDLIPNFCYFTSTWHNSFFKNLGFHSLLLQIVTTCNFYVAFWVTWFVSVVSSIVLYFNHRPCF